MFNRGPRIDNVARLASLARPQIKVCKRTLPIHAAVAVSESGFSGKMQWVLPSYER
jgi:hypothetical protein